MSSYKGHPVIPDSDASQERSAGFPAKYQGVCVVCRGPIAVGQQVTRGPVGGWCHVSCPTMPVSGVQNGTVPTRTVERESGQAGVQAGLPGGLPNGVWTVEGPRDHRTYRISTVLAPSAPVHQPNPTDQDDSFRAKHAGKRVLQLLTGPDNTASYKGLAWYDGRIGRLWNYGKQPNVELLINVFAKLVERGEHLDGYTVHFAKHCLKCNRLLTTPESIQRGIGPVCASGGWD